MSEWQPIETAPKDGPAFQAKIPGHGEDNVIAWVDGLVDGAERPCGGWEWMGENEPPDCWTDGICWEVNEDGQRSVHPSEWKPLQYPLKEG